MGEKEGGVWKGGRKGEREREREGRMQEDCEGRWETKWECGRVEGWENKGRKTNAVISAHLMHTPPQDEVVAEAMNKLHFQRVI